MTIIRKIFKTQKTFIFIIFIFIISEFCSVSEKSIKKIDENLNLGELIVDGLKRNFIFYNPQLEKDKSKKYPLVVLLHGRFGNASIMLKDNELLELAKTEEFFLLVPNGYSRSWADGRGTTPAEKENINDVKFIEELINHVSKKYSIDTKNIFITGHSNGGFMTQRMLLEKTNLFRAGVSVAAYISKSNIERFTPLKPISVAFMAGTDDPLVPYEGGFVSGGAEILGAEDTISRWLKWNSCENDPLVLKKNKEKDDTDLEIYTYKTCENDVTVKLYKILGGGHMWPGTVQKIPLVNMGRPTFELNASKEIWNFFKSNMYKAEKSIPEDSEIK